MENSKYNYQPIRIAQVIGKWVGGGVEAVVMTYYRHIDRNKIQFDFICDNDSTNIPYEEIKKLGGKVILVPPYQKIFAYHKELKRIFKEDDYKIVHSHINTLSIFPLYAAKCAGVPIRIAHNHSTTNKKEWKKNLLKQTLRPFSKVFATHYFACSEYAGRWLFGNKEYEKGNVFLLNNAIEVDKFKYDEKVRKEVRKELKIKEDTVVIGHIGRFVAQKNHTFLSDIFNEYHKLNSNSLLLLVGQGPLEEEIKEKVKKLGLEDSVKFLGQRNDANRLYQAFDLFLLPSLYEGLPVVGVEAQASGLLCILSKLMTKETKILQSTQFISLEQSDKEWAKIINKELTKYKRKDTTKEITNNHFNIVNESDKLVYKYIDFLERINKMKKSKTKYTPKYFKEGLPEWKRIKDPFTSRIFYRPLSFVTSSIATNLGMTANMVSYISIIIAICACTCFIIPNYLCNIIGAILVNLWLLSDCTDGNIARSVKKQPFGDFADSISSYILVGLLATSIGIATYFDGGLLIHEKCIWIVLLGALASSSDTLMRLIYQKYKSSERNLADEGKLEIEYDKRTDNNQTNSLLVRLESDFGIGGILPILVLIGTIFHALDLVIIYCFIYYFSSSLLMIMKYIIRAIKKTKEIDNK